MGRLCRHCSNVAIDAGLCALHARVSGGGGQWATRKGRRFRMAYLLSHPYCVDCAAKGHSTPANEVHHEQPRAVRPDLAFDANNCVALCSDCHKKRERNMNAGPRG